MTKILVGKVWSTFLYTIASRERPPVFIGPVPGSRNEKALKSLKRHINKLFQVQLISAVFML